MLQIGLVQRVEPEAFAERLQAVLGKVDNLLQLVARQQKATGLAAPAIVALQAFHVQIERKALFVVVHLDFLARRGASRDRNIL